MKQTFQTFSFAACLPCKIFLDSITVFYPLAGILEVNVQGRPKAVKNRVQPEKQLKLVHAYSDPS